MKKTAILIDRQAMSAGRQGFSLIEVLVTVVISGVLALSGMAAYGKMKQVQEMEAVAIKIGQMMNMARVRSITGEDDSSWKVDFTTEKVRLLNDDGLVKEEYWLPSSYSLIGSGGEIGFSRADGRVDVCGTGCDFEVRQTGGSQVYEFRVLYSGIVEY